MLQGRATLLGAPATPLAPLLSSFARYDRPFRTATATMAPPGTAAVVTTLADGSRPTALIRHETNPTARAISSGPLFQIQEADNPYHPAHSPRRPASLQKVQSWRRPGRMPGPFPPPRGRPQESARPGPHPCRPFRAERSGERRAIGRCKFPIRHAATTHREIQEAFGGQFRRGGGVGIAWADGTSNF